ncbi:MAG: hypothetical protein GVY28_01780 [Alphaproteobacteria bacterium]|jgi:exosortase|nr:hypothetical protein [Alphaproteobacteria bacterium]
MSTVTATNDSGAVAADAGRLIQTHGWVQIATLGVLFVALFWDILYRVVGVAWVDGELATRGYAWTNPNWSHALIVPLISLYFLHQHRAELKQAAATPTLVPRGDAIGLWSIVLSVAMIGVLGLGLRAAREPMVNAAPDLAGLYYGMYLHYLSALVLGAALGYGLGRMLMGLDPVARFTQAFMRSAGGVVLLLMGIALYFITLGPRAFNNDMFKGYGMIMALGGLVWYVSGWSVARLALFPVAYLVFAIKISDRLWETVAFKLQGIAAAVSGVAINVFGLLIDLEARVRGNTIELYHHGAQLSSGLNVEEACSGLRMLMTFIALGFAVAYLARRPWWARLAIVLLTVPIAILVNVGRVTALGLLYPYKPEWTQGQPHIFIGMLMLIPAFGLFTLIGWIMNQIFLPDPQAEHGGGGP